MSNTVFREKSIQRIASPEQLTDYIRVTNPGVWVTLTAVIVLLIGFVVWGVVGSLETKLDTVVVSAGGTTLCYVREADIGAVTAGCPVRIGKAEYECTVSAVPAQPEAVEEDFPAYALHLSGLTTGEWVYALPLDIPLPEGVFPASVITGRVSPISFLFN